MFDFLLFIEKYILSRGREMREISLIRNVMQQGKKEREEICEVPAEIIQDRKVLL